MKSIKKILVLGAKGMLGNTVYSYLKTIYANTYGTDRTDHKFFLFDAATDQRDFNKLFKKIEVPDFIINCIGILPNSKNKEQMRTVNTLFPKKLGYLAQKLGPRIINISTDAVFSNDSGIVFENSHPNPDTDYGKSKLKGEVNSKNVINIRTSIIGFNPYNHKGLLEWAIRERNIKGFINHSWSGCTTLQYAKACNYLISGNNFDKISSKSSIIHYAPLGPISKYKLLKCFLQKINVNNKVMEVEDNINVDRELKSIYNVLPGNKNLSFAISELLNFLEK